MNWKGIFEEIAKIPSWLGVILALTIMAGVAYFTVGQSYDQTSKEIDEIKAEVNTINTQLGNVITFEEYTHEMQYLSAKVTLMEMMIENFDEINEIEVNMILDIIESKHTSPETDLLIKEFRILKTKSIEKQNRIKEQLQRLDEHKNDGR